MILGRKQHIHASAFDELNRAVEILDPIQRFNAKLPQREVMFNAHAFPEQVPVGALIYNLENVGIQVAPDAFKGHEVWDFSRRNVAKWTREVKYVPVGYHHTMERFQKRPWSECDIDVVFTGSPCVRRHHILDSLTQRGLNVLQVPHLCYGKGRDAYLARSKLALNIQYYEDGVHPVLRSAHCVANRLPILCETSPEIPDWVNLQTPYEDMIERVVGLVKRRRELLEYLAESAYLAFRMCPMVLPT